jgi:hypothetical protein
LDRIGRVCCTDIAYVKLLDQMKKCLVRQYWIEDSLLYARGGRVYVLMETCQQELLKETHYIKWTDHPDVEWMRALLSRRFFLSKIE